MLKTEEEIKTWLRMNNIEKYTIHTDLSVDVLGDVDLSDKKLAELPIQFNTVFGSFDCSLNHLKSLKGSPYKVTVNFNASTNRLESLKYGPLEVGNNYSCANNQLSTFEGSPKFIYGNFNYSGNKILAFENSNAPKVKGDVITGNQDNPFGENDLALWEHVKDIESTIEDFDMLEENFYNDYNYDKEIKVDSFKFKTKKNSYQKTLDLINKIDKKIEPLLDNSLSKEKEGEEYLSKLHRRSFRSKVPLSYKTDIIKKPKITNNIYHKAIKKENEAISISSFKKMLLYFKKVLDIILSKENKKMDSSEKKDIPLKNENFEDKLYILNDLINKYQTNNVNKYTRELPKESLEKLQMLQKTFVVLANNTKEIDIEDKKTLYKILIQFIPSMFEAYENIEEKEINGVNNTNSHQILDESLSVIHQKVKSINDVIQDKKISQLSVINRSIKASLGG